MMLKRTACLLALLLMANLAVARPACGAPAGKERPTSPHAVALHARWLAVPGWTLAPYLDQYTELYRGWAVGAEYLYQHPGFDVVISIDYTGLPMNDGNFRGKGERQTDFVHFEGLGVLSGEVSLIGRWRLTRFMEIRVGAGLGIGGVLGDIYKTQNAGAESCGPENSRCEKVTTYPMNVRVVPVLNTLLGLRFRLHRNVYLRAETGWRLVGFYAGAAPEIHF